MKQTVEPLTRNDFMSGLVDSRVGHFADMVFKAISESSKANPYLDNIGLPLFRNEGMVLKMGSYNMTSFYLKSGIVDNVWIRPSGMVGVELDYNRSVGFKQRKFMLIDPRRKNSIKELKLSDYLLESLFFSRFATLRREEAEKANKLLRQFVNLHIECSFPEHVVKLFHSIADEDIPVPISLCTLLNEKYCTKTDILSQGGHKELPFKSLNRYPFAVGLIMRDSQNLLPHDAFGRLTGKKNSDALAEVLRGVREYSIKDFVTTGLAAFMYPNIDPHVSKDYVRVCRDNACFLDVSIGNERTMIHTIRNIKGLHRPDSKLEISQDFLDLAEKLGPEYHLIRTEYELQEEADLQHNCVASYKEGINRGSCAIFSSEQDGQHYTIEVRPGADGFYCNQFLGFANKISEKSEELKRELCSKLDEINREGNLSFEEPGYYW